jgi:hypothetical protein
MHYSTEQVPQAIRMTDILDLVAVEQLFKLCMTPFYNLFTEMSEWLLVLVNELKNVPD